MMAARSAPEALYHAYHAYPRYHVPLARLESLSFVLLTILVFSVL